MEMKPMKHEVVYNSICCVSVPLWCN